MSEPREGSAEPDISARRDGEVDKCCIQLRATADGGELPPSGGQRQPDDAPSGCTDTGGFDVRP